jgi:hypothetical protein
MKDFKGVWSGRFLEYVGEDTPQFKKGEWHLVMILASSMKPCIRTFANDEVVERIELEKLNPSDWEIVIPPNDFELVTEKG